MTTIYISTVCGLWSLYHNHTGSLMLMKQLRYRWRQIICEYTCLLVLCHDVWHLNADCLGWCCVMMCGTWMLTAWAVLIVWKPWTIQSLLQTYAQSGCWNSYAGWYQVSTHAWFLWHVWHLTAWEVVSYLPIPIHIIWRQEQRVETNLGGVQYLPIDI